MTIVGWGAGARGLLYGTVPPQLDHAAGYMNWWNGRLRRVDPPDLVDCDSVLGPTFLTRRSCIDQMRFFFPADRFLASELEFCTRVKRTDIELFVSRQPSLTTKEREVPDLLISPNMVM